MDYKQLGKEMLLALVFAALIIIIILLYRQTSPFIYVSF